MRPPQSAADGTAEVDIAGKVHILPEPGQALEPYILGVDAQVEETVPAHSAGKDSFRRQRFDPEILKRQDTAVIAVAAVDLIDKEFIERAVISVDMAFHSGVGQRAPYFHGIAQIARHRIRRVERLTEGLQTHARRLDSQIETGLSP